MPHTPEHLTPSPTPTVTNTNTAVRPQRPADSCTASEEELNSLADRLLTLGNGVSSLNDEELQIFKNCSTKIQNIFIQREKAVNPNVQQSIANDVNALGLDINSLPLPADYDKKYRDVIYDILQEYGPEVAKKLNNLFRLRQWLENYRYYNGAEISSEEVYESNNNEKTGKTSFEINTKEVINGVLIGELTNKEIYFEGKNGNQTYVNTSQSNGLTFDMIDRVGQLIGGTEERETTPAGNAFYEAYGNVTLQTPEELEIAFNPPKIELPTLPEPIVTPQLSYEGTREFFVQDGQTFEMTPDTRPIGEYTSFKVDPYGNVLPEGVSFQASYNPIDSTLSQNYNIPSNVSYVPREPSLQQVEALYNKLKQQSELQSKQEANNAY